jgi:hypothetical protein
VKIGESAMAVAIPPNRDAKSKISPLIYGIEPEKSGESYKSRIAALFWKNVSLLTGKFVKSITCVGGERWRREGYSLSKRYKNTIPLQTFG